MMNTLQADAPPMAQSNLGRPPRATNSVEVLGYETGETSMGAFLVALSPRGVRAILLGDAPAPLLGELQQALPDAAIMPHEDPRRAISGQVEILIEKPWTAFQPPMDLGKGDFEQLVHAALNWTGAGTTVTPEQVACLIGAHPSTALRIRKLAAANLVAVAVPFHRLQDAGGTSPYYRWGETRRQAFLRRERGALSWWL
jgi:AraC family transcriptional regulator of adaptative response/methylated-DNA-[protein]-cysteine methyltransferase